MKSKYFIIVFIVALGCGWISCSSDVANTGESVLDSDDAILVLADTFDIQSGIDSCSAIISQADSFLLGEIESEYGALRASILTQFACPEGYSYPEGAEVDSVCLFMYYSSWIGDGNSPMAIDAYTMDKATFNYFGTYPTDLQIENYCSRSNMILNHHRVVVASEKMDSIINSNGVYVPMLRMKLNESFKDNFGKIRTFPDQENFNQLFKGLLIETSFGSATILNISDIALGVYYHFSYDKAGKDTIVNDMKAFYANSEVRTVNHIRYQDKLDWIDELKADSNFYNYIVAPAGVYTRLTFPMAEIEKSILTALTTDSLSGEIYFAKRPYVNLAKVEVEAVNIFSGTEAKKTRNDWLQPANYMLLIKENSVNRFFRNKELPSDTCALLSALTQKTDSAGNTIYYYSYDLSDFLTNQLRKETQDSLLQMLLVPVSVATASSNGISAVSSVRQQQTVSATKIRSAQNGMNLKLVYSGF